MSIATLFSPIRIHTLHLPNRAVMPAMGTGYGDREGRVTERLTAYLARRAQGGVGLIITEVCAVDQRGKGFPAEIGAWDDAFIPGLHRIVAAVHAKGSKVALQLHHAGRETFASVVGALPEAPSPIPSAILMQPCEEMSQARIKAVIEAYAQAAHRAKTAGFDAVEIHGAHGYLITQFLSPFSNQRQDAYGGSDENRARFALEIIEAVRGQVGPDFPILMRLSTEELINGGYGIEFTQWLAPRLVAAGVNAIHASVGVYSTPGNLSVASMDTPAGFNLPRARAIKQCVDVPVIGVGRICDPRLADEAIRNGDADLISFGRQHLADPDFLAKARRGVYDDIRWCLGCNQGCIDRLSYEMKAATCTINPDCGQEYKNESPSSSSKRVWIIGAGPAGLAAALSAVERGHTPEIYERAPAPGGQLLPAGQPPHKQSFLAWVEWATRTLAQRGVTIRTSVNIDEAVLTQAHPEAVILATGACPILPGILDHPSVCDARAVLMGAIPLRNPAVILGAGYVGMETADFLIARCLEVTILEQQPLPPVGKHTAHGYWLHRRLRKGGATLILGAVVERITDEAVMYRLNDQEHRIAPLPMVINALGAKSEDGLKDILTRLAIPFTVVGDAKAPRRLIEAIHEGSAAGKAV